MPAEQRKRRRWSVVNGLLKPSVVTGILTPCLSVGQSNAGLLQFVDNRVEFGVWGGLTERQRRALLRKNPDITDWAAYLAAGGELIGI